MQNVGKAIGQFAGVFDAFSKANEKNEAADADMSMLNFQMEMDKKEAEFGQTYQGDGKNYVDQSNTLFDGAASEFKQKHYGKYSPETQQKLDRGLLGLKVGHQRKSITKGAHFQNNHAALKMAEYSGTVTTGMLTPENLKTRGIGIVEEAANKYFKSVDTMAAAPNIKKAAKLAFVKNAAKHVQDKAPAISLLKWKEKREKEINAANDRETIEHQGHKIELVKPLKQSAADIDKPAEQRVAEAQGKWDGKDVKTGVAHAADELGVPAWWLAAVMSYETAGSMNPRQDNLGGNGYKGYIQWSPENVRRYGINFSTRNAAIRSQLGRNGSIVKYYKDRGWKKGMSLEQFYATVNAGRPHLTNRTDENNGGAPGTVAQKVRGKVFQGHVALAKKAFGGGKVASYKKEQPKQDVASMVFSEINWGAVEKRYTAEQDQAFIQSVARGETKVSPHDSGFMKKWNKSFDQILKPDTNLLKDDNARNLVISLADNKAPMPKQVFEKIRGHIESIDPSERSKGFELLNMLEGKNPAAFNKGDNAQHLSKQLGIYRTMANFKGPEGAVKDMIHMEDRLSKMSKDELKSEKGAFLKTLNDVDFGSVLEGIHGGDVFDADDAFSPIERARMMSEFRTLAVGEFEKYGNGEYAKAAAVSMLRKRYGETNVTGANTIMKYPPEMFVDPENHGWVKSHFQGVARQVMAIEGAALKAQGFKIIEPVLLSDDETERTAVAALKGAKSKEQVIMMPGVSMDREVAASPKWRIGFRVEKDGEQIVIPSDHYYLIDGLAQKNHDEVSSKLLDKRAHDELKDAGGKGARYDSPMALHNHFRWLGGWMLGDEELKTPGELVDKRKEIQDRESID